MDRNCKLKIGDKVAITEGKDKGKQGKLIKINKKKGTGIVEGLNLAKKHVKPRGDFKGWILDIELPLDLSKLALFCDNCTIPVKLGIKGEGKDKKRFCKKCNTLV